jgi:V/A-type H+/Na+-transporting ATPase subunit C
MTPDATSAYAAINARVRVMYSTLLTKQEFSSFIEAFDLDSLINLLKHTAYAPFLDRAKEKELNPRRTAFLMRERWSESCHSIISGVPEYARPFLTQLLRYYEINNLKAILRGIAANSEWDRVRFVLFPLGSDSSLPAQAMLESHNVTQAIEMIKNTSYYETLSFAMKRYSAEQTLFSIEVALDLDYWREFWSLVKKLPKPDQDYATHIVGSLIDMNNLMWAIRYRTYHHLSEEEIINYTLPFGYHVHDDDIRSIAAGSDISQIVKRLYPQISGLDELLQDLHSGLPKLEILLKNQVLEQCKAAFIGNPFQIGIPLGYLLLLDQEIQELVFLLEAKSNNLPVEKYQNFLSID